MLTWMMIVVTVMTIVVMMMTAAAAALVHCTSTACVSWDIFVPDKF